MLLWLAKLDAGVPRLFLQEWNLGGQSRGELPAPTQASHARKYLPHHGWIRTLGIRTAFFSNSVQPDGVRILLLMFVLSVDVSWITNCIANVAVDMSTGTPSSQTLECACMCRGGMLPGRSDYP